MNETKFTTKKLAKLTGVQPATIRDWRRCGLLDGVRVGRGWVFTFRDLVAARSTKRLLGKGIPLKDVSLAVESLRKQEPAKHNPLVRLRMDGLSGRLVLNEGAHWLDLSNGQLSLNLERSEQSPEVPLHVPSDAQKTVDGSPMSTFRQIFDRAHQEEESGNWLSAANLYRTLIRIQPDNLEVIVNLGNCHFHQGELGVAIEIYRAALQLHSDCTEAWYNLGNALDESHRFSEAVHAFEMALKLDSTRFEIHFNMALTLEKSGQSDAAHARWQTVLELAPDEHARQMATLFLEAYSGD